METVLRFEEALGVVLEHARLAAAGGVRRVERVRLEDALGRALREDVRADRDQPPFDRATRDGYAMRAADASEGVLYMGEVAAGGRWCGPPLEHGDAVEVMTGAPLPAGADAVAMLEHVTEEKGWVRLLPGRTLHPGENVVRQGAEAKAGDVLLRAGVVVGAAEVAVAASCGAAELTVYARPRVAVVATGDELVCVGEKPEAWQIRNSNSAALAAMVRAGGGEAWVLGVVRDEREAVRARIAEALARERGADLLVLSGGVSAGKYDLVEEILAEAGAEFLFTGAKIQPGKPVVFGRLRRSESASKRVSESAGGWTYFFGLPGNPVSTQVCFALFVAPVLRALAGREEIAPRFVEARLAEDVKGGAAVTRFLPARLESAWDGVLVRVVAWQGSGDVAANARANAYVVLPAEVAGFKRGETVRVLLR